eukprot:TRINITY_DN229_c0_g1_i1.p1 TRINITY_DN229_c0_g1~~TRINITY_DN229_c0_g1_i1.p1  ORF type:complete len:314 (+),score=32.52 TRINITY_DN229_c0_g1_i1:92-1033(+)
MASSTLKVLVGGGTGFIGGSVCKILKQKGHQVTVISRSQGPERISWDQLRSDPIKYFPECDVVINVPGANLMEKRWTPQRKQELLDSRLQPTRILVQAINKCSKERPPPSLILSGSAIGKYPQTNSPNPPVLDESCLETDMSFAGELCQQWEDVLKEISTDLPIRKAISRTAVVLGRDQGALKQMLPPFRFFVGASFGNGQQYFPWTHIEDLVRAYLHIIEQPQVEGPVNMCAPEQVTNEQFSKALGKAINRPVLFKIPEFAVNGLFGESAHTLTKGVRLEPKKLKESNFSWKYPTLSSAFDSIFAEERNKGR